MADQVYDGFISYSHAADGLLAPRLQAGLQRFAKPWWKRRAVRIFRDESSLSANPHLWSSITEALDASGWFVLLLSPDAARSEWVNQEIAYWKTHRDPSRILPVVTDGEFGWADGDVTGDAVPDQLGGVFSEEPRWVDLRFARDEDQLDLKDPRFADAVADVASTVRGVAKDDLASEEVRQHRRTIRTAWAAAGLVAALAIVAIAFAGEATRNANDAERSAAEAERQAELAAELADSESEARALAEREAQISKTRELAASAVAALLSDPELAIMLSLTSIASTPEDAEPSPEALTTLREATISNRLEARFETGDYARISPDGSSVVYGDAGTGQVVSRAIETRTERWRSARIDGGDLGRVEISPSGSVVTVQVHRSDGMDVVVLDGATGSAITTLHPSEGCSGLDLDGISTATGFSPGGEWFTARGGTSGCQIVAGESWVAVYDTTTWDEAHRLNTEDGLAFAADFSADGSRVMISSDGLTAELRSFPDLELIRLHEDARSYVALSSDGLRMAYLSGPRGPILADAETGEVLYSFAQAADAWFFAEEFDFSPDGSKVLVSTIGRDFVFDGQIGALVASLAVGPTTSGSFSRDGSRLLTSTSSTSLLWRFGVGQRVADATFEGDWVNPDQGQAGRHLAVNVIAFETGLHLAVIDPVSGEVTASRSGWGYELSDGRFVVLAEDGVIDEPDSYRFGPLQVWDPADGSIVDLAGCIASLADLEGEAGPSCPDGEGPLFAGLNVQDHFAAVVDTSGSHFAARSTDLPRRVFVWERDSLELRSEFEIEQSGSLVGMTSEWIVIRADQPELSSGLGADRLVIYDLEGSVVAEILGTPGAPFERSVQLDPSRRLLFAVNREGRVVVHRLGTWEAIGSFDAHRTSLRGWHLDLDTGRLAIGTQDGVLTVWDVGGMAEGAVPESPDFSVDVGDRVSDVVWISSDELVAFVIDLELGARWFTLPLSTDGLVERGRSQMLRGFTSTECATYRMDPCPTLEVLRDG